MRLPNTAVLICFLFLLSACKEPEPESTKAISSEQVSKDSFMKLLMEEDEETYEGEDSELYFSDSKGKIFYAQHSGNKISFRTQLLLGTLFREAKDALPSVSRKKKLNISLEIDANANPRKEILQAAQDYILSNKQYQYANTDAEALAVLQRVLKEEEDSLYQGQQSIQTKKKSDIVLFLNASKDAEKMIITAKIISKNGTILAQRTNETYINEDINKNKEWIDVYVPRSHGGAQVFEIMRNAITLEQYSGIPSSKPISNVSYITASQYCQNNMQGQLTTPYVFENARKSLAMARPSSPITMELIAAYDEDDDEVFYVDGDNIDSNDKPLTYHWNSEKYYAVSKLFKSKSTTFRCMRAK